MSDSTPPGGQHPEIPPAPAGWSPDGYNPPDPELSQPQGSYPPQWQQPYPGGYAVPPGYAPPQPQAPRSEVATKALSLLVDKRLWAALIVFVALYVFGQYAPGNLWRDPKPVYVVCLVDDKLKGFESPMKDYVRMFGALCKKEGPRSSSALKEAMENTVLITGTVAGLDVNTVKPFEESVAQEDKFIALILETKLTKSSSESKKDDDSDLKATFGIGFIVFDRSKIKDKKGQQPSSPVQGQPQMASNNEPHTVYPNPEDGIYQTLVKGFKAASNQPVGDIQFVTGIIQQQEPTENAEEGQGQ